MTLTSGGARDWEQLAAQAEGEAAHYPLPPQHEAAVQAAIDRARRQLGGDRVESHTVSFKPERWASVSQDLPPYCTASGKISRGDLFTIASRGRDDDVLWQLFAASYVWGQGNNGYGLARLKRILSVTPKDQLVALIREAFSAGDRHGPMAAYDVLRGEHRYRAAGPHWGAAFFTKALYIGLRNGPASPLILDRVMARRVSKLSDMPHLLYRGFGYNWSPYRYGVYLAWMRQTAKKFDVKPELLEFALFKM